MKPRALICYTDGGARGNPGPAGIGVVLMDGRGVVDQHQAYLGETTNNQAEYQALFRGLTLARQHGATTVECRLDSELVVQQLNLRYKIKDRDLAPWFTKIWNLKQQFKRVTFRHVPRSQNRVADALVNQAIDEALGS